MNDSNQSIPEGLEFLRLVAGQEQACESETATVRTQLGVKAPACLEAIGTMLSLLDRLASCSWGCRGGDHVIEYLTGRSVALVRAALRLSGAAYYDEALGLARSLGEIANLFALFQADRRKLAEWRQASRRERIHNFGPAAVRRELANSGAPQPISNDRYSALCEVSTHVTPHTRPQALNPLLMPSLGATFSRTGYLVTLNELAVPLVFVGIFASSLLAPPTEFASRFPVAARTLAENIGGANIIDGYPRLNDETLSELRQMVAQAPEPDRVMLWEAIRRMADLGPPSDYPMDDTSPAAQQGHAAGRPQAAGG